MKWGSAVKRTFLSWNFWNRAMHVIVIVIYLLHH